MCCCVKCSCYVWGGPGAVTSSVNAASRILPPAIIRNVAFFTRHVSRTVCQTKLLKSLARGCHLKKAEGQLLIWLSAPDERDLPPRNVSVPDFLFPHVYFSPAEPLCADQKSICMICRVIYAFVTLYETQFCCMEHPSSASVIFHYCCMIVHRLVTVSLQVDIALLFSREAGNPGGNGC